MLKYKIYTETKIPQVRQRLIHEQTVLEDSAQVADFKGDDEYICFQLIQISRPKSVWPHAPPCDSSQLFSAIKSSNVEKCMQLLSLEKLPGLNEADYNDWTILHYAAWGGLPEVCLAILE